MGKVLAISGSPRSEGNTDTLLESIVKGVEETGCEVETVYLRNYAINPCVGCEGCRKTGYCVYFDDGMSLFYPKIYQSTGLILGSPVRQYNISSLMKAFIDRLYPFYLITNTKPRQFSSRLGGQKRHALVYAVGEQKIISDMRLALPAMALPLQALAFDIAIQSSFRGFFNKNEIAASKKSLIRAYLSGNKLGAMILSEKREDV